MPKQSSTIPLWNRIDKLFDITDSFLVGGPIGIRIGVLAALFFFADNFLRTFWSGVFDISDTNRYFFPGAALALSVLLVYVASRIGKMRWFIATVGPFVTKIPLIGGGYKQGIWLMYQRHGFLKPVWVFRNGLLEFDADNNVAKKLLGSRRRALFLREVYDDNPELPPAYRLTCECLIPPPQLVGGEPELFPFELTYVQTQPGIGAFAESIYTQGVSGYTDMSTLEWSKARTVLKFKSLPEKDQKLLEGLGIVIRKDFGQPRTDQSSN